MTERRTNTTKLIFAFRKFTEVPKTVCQNVRRIFFSLASDNLYSDTRRTYRFYMAFYWKICPEISRLFVDTLLVIFMCFRILCFSFIFSQVMPWFWRFVTQFSRLLCDFHLTVRLIRFLLENVTLM